MVVSSSTEVIVTRTTGVRNGDCDPSIPVDGDCSSGQRTHNNQADTSPDPIDLKSGEVDKAKQSNLSVTEPTALNQGEDYIIAPTLDSDAATSSSTNPPPSEDPAAPSPTPPSRRPFNHHPWAPRLTPQGLRREYAFNHKSHFEIAWLPEFGYAIPRTVEEALPAHYFPETPDAIGPSSQAPASAHVPAEDVPKSPSGGVKRERDESEGSGEGDSRPERLTRSKVSKADVKPPVTTGTSDASQEGNSQLHRERSMAPGPESVPSPAKAHKRRRNRDEREGSETRSTRRTRSKRNDV